MPKASFSALPYPSQRVVVLRHGERRDSAPDAPVESDPPLTEAGVAAIKTAAARLKRLLGEDEARRAALVVSPFLRTLQTAESLQHHGVGAAHAVVIDNTLCEVFGPSRIKTSRAPQLHTRSRSRAVGGLPVWGESIEAATERYVANFLRNGDVYGGFLSATTSRTDSSLSRRDESPTSSSPVVPEAVTNRNTGCPLSGNGSPIALERRKMRTSSTLSDAPPRDVILVTHGDAISAVVSHFYPTRIVYEANFLSFIIMRRCGVGNHVYHLETSAGVSWFVEGVDREPQDPILRSLEKRRLAEECCSGSGCDSGSKDEDDSFDADDEDGEADVPSSFAGARMRPRRADGFRDNSRANRCPRSYEQSRVEKLSPVRAANSYDPTTNSQATGGTAENDCLKGSFSLSAAGGHTPPPLPARRLHQRHHQPSNRPQNPPDSDSPTAHAAGAVPTPAPPQLRSEYPKAGEGCERIRLPTGTPAQSSSHSVATDINGRNSGECEEGAKADEVCSGPSEHRNWRSHSMRDDSAAKNWQSEERSDAGKRFMPGEPGHDSSLGLVSGYGGLSEELSADSRVRSPVTSVAESASTVARIDGTRPWSRSATTTAAAKPGSLVSYGSGAADASVRRFEGDRADDGLSVRGGASRTASSHLAFANAAATEALSDSTDSLDRQMDRQQSVISAAFVSLGLRVAAALFILCYLLVQRHSTTALRFGVFALAWEVGFGVVLYYSCRSGGWRMRRLRRVVEQLHLDVLCAGAKVTTAGRQFVSIDDAGSLDRSRGTLSTPQRLHPLIRPWARMPEYVSAATWRGHSGGVDGDASMTNSLPQRTMPSVMFGVRLVATIVAKLLIISALSFASAVLCGSRAPQAMTDVHRLYKPTVGFALLLTYGFVCLVRGLWDETKLDIALDSA
ncbi:hypothetical protein GH5_01106 [Leishmania sp. Ghana 2012 LV757]|uniref:hypothetical protein n=1 Tax=Leishmania sp. Ghana 2012 LV757 TaxID=2803181 RepID=UPI001B443798|nr:hypothetical protein GH5_01106 [Leishmania sp. Ghana 2012 LV757]